MVHPDDRERSFAELANLIAGGNTRHLENRILCKDGSYRWLSWSAVPDRGVIYSVARDITDLKRTQEQLHALRGQLAHASRQTTMGAMTASIAHEIGQPLAAIIANASAGLRWLRRLDPDLEEAQVALNDLGDAHRTNEVIAGIAPCLEGGWRGQSGGYCLLVGESPIGAAGLETHRILLHNNMRDGLPEVMGKRVQLHQVFLNLIMNAIEAMSSVKRRRTTPDNRIQPRRARECQGHGGNTGAELPRLTLSASLTLS